MYPPFFQTKVGVTRTRSRELRPRRAQNGSGAWMIHSRSMQSTDLSFFALPSTLPALKAPRRARPYRAPTFVRRLGGYSHFTLLSILRIIHPRLFVPKTPTCCPILGPRKWTKNLGVQRSRQKWVYPPMICRLKGAHMATAYGKHAVVPALRAN